MNEWAGALWLFQIIALAGVVWFAASLLRPRAVIRIQIHEGTVKVVAGRIRRQFLADLADVLANAHLTEGTITAPSLQSGRVIFRFSHEFSPELQLQIRNIWYASS